MSSGPTNPTADAAAQPPARRRLFCTCDAAGNIAKWGPRAVELTGFPAPDVLGRPLVELLVEPGRVGGRVVDVLAGVAAAGGDVVDPYYFSFRRRKPRDPAAGAKGGSIGGGAGSGEAVASGAKDAEGGAGGGGGEKEEEEELGIVLEVHADTPLLCTQRAVAMGRGAAGAAAAGAAGREAAARGTALFVLPPLQRYDATGRVMGDIGIGQDVAGIVEEEVKERASLAKRRFLSYVFRCCCSLFTVRCTLFTVYSSLNTLHYTLYTVHSTLFTVHYTSLYHEIFTLPSPFLHISSTLSPHTHPHTPDDTSLTQVHIP